MLLAFLLGVWGVTEPNPELWIMFLCSPQAFLDEFKGLLLRETVKEPNEGDLVGKAKPIVRAPALAKLHEIFLGQGGRPFELVAGKHYLCDTANAEIQKDASLAYKITRISLVPSLP